MIDPGEVEMGECQQCGLPLPDGGKLCAACGNKMTVLIQEWDSSPLADGSDREEGGAVDPCSGCGPENTMFCDQCEAGNPPDGESEKEGDQIPKCKYCNQKSVWNITEDEIPVCAKHSSIYMRTEGRMDANLPDFPDDPEPDESWEGT